MSKDIWIFLALFGVFYLNVILGCIWNYRATKHMKNRGVSFSGSYDAGASAIVIYSLLHVIGTVLITLAIFYDYKDD